MQKNSKTVLIKKMVMEDIAKLRSGEAIPSRKSYMLRTTAARATVDRAINELISDGILYARQGSGTFTAPEHLHKHSIKQVYIIGAYDPGAEKNFPPGSLEYIVQQKRPVKAIKFSRLERSINDISRPGSAVIWKFPGYEHLMTIYMLESLHIPQLLYNRDFGDFSCINLDIHSSISAGLDWLTAGDDQPMAFISSAPHPRYPFIKDRQLAFFELALRRSIRVPGKWMFCDFPRQRDEQRYMKSVVKKLFPPQHSCKAVYLDYAHWYTSFIESAAAIGKYPGKDYKLLVFDRPSESLHEGTAAMCQGWQIAEEWIDSFLENPQHKLTATFKTDLITR